MQHHHFKTNSFNIKIKEKNTFIKVVINEVNVFQKLT